VPPARTVQDVLITADLAVPCDVPTKQGPTPGAALDWPRRWREFVKESPEAVIESMRSGNHNSKYDNTIAFVSASMRYHEELERFMAQGPGASSIDARVSLLNGQPSAQFSG
jgi:hypothetical protein